MCSTQARGPTQSPLSRREEGPHSETLTRKKRGAHRFCHFFSPSSSQYLLRTHSAAYNISLFLANYGQDLLPLEIKVPLRVHLT